MVMVALDEEVGYRSAFEDFSQKAQRVQLLTEHPSGDRKAFETALLELEKAHLAYNQARDAFMQSLLPAAVGTVHDRSLDYSRDIPTIAELLWEGAGRPTGTAEEDWRRAEAIVDCAAKSFAS
jgi:Protein of unknown function (DUF2934)